MGEKHSYIIHLFKSRNKDNKNIEGFKEREHVFLVDEMSEKQRNNVAARWTEFTSLALPGEICRHYVSVNERDMDKIRDNLIIWMLQNKQPLLHMSAKTCSIAMKPECAITKKWLIDVDTNNTSQLKAVEFDVLKAMNHGDKMETHSTPNGYAIVVPHGFDTRELLEKYPFVENKRDGMLCCAWQTKK